MSDVRPAELRYAKGTGEGFVHTAAFEWLSRAGFVARAAIYAIIGVLALQLAIGEGGKLTDQQGALQTVANQAFGTILLTRSGVSSAPRWGAGPKAPTPVSSGFPRLRAVSRTGPSVCSQWRS
jgi:Domain of Unknown Function (DUF1206)